MSCTTHVRLQALVHVPVWMWNVAENHFRTYYMAIQDRMKHYPWHVHVLITFCVWRTSVATPLPTREGHWASVSSVGLTLPVTDCANGLPVDTKCSSANSSVTGSKLAIHSDRDLRLYFWSCDWIYTVKTVIMGPNEGSGILHNAQTVAEIDSTIDIWTDYWL